MKASKGWPILTYHSLDKSGSIVSTSPDNFRYQMQHLKDRGYRGISLREMVAAEREGTSFTEKTVVLTFDDGFRNFYTEAFPILSEHDFTATVFLVTDLCGQHNDWAGNPKDLPRSRLLDWNEVRELAGAGIEFGSHTRGHPDLTRLSPEAIHDEMLGSKSAIADRLGSPVSTFAYPYGRINREARRIASDNFDASCSTNLGKVNAGHDRASLNRIDAYYVSDRRVFERMTTPAFDSYLRIRQTMRQVRSVITGH